MNSTTFLIAVFVVSMVVSITLHIVALQWGMRRTQIAQISATKAVLYLILFMIVGGFGSLLVGTIVGSLGWQPSEIEEGILGICIFYATAAFLIAKIFKADFIRAARAALPLFALSIVLPLVAIFGIRPYFYEAYFAPTNSMAPTILGPHLTGPCPRCGEAAYGSVPDQTQSAPTQPIMMICGSDLRSCLVKQARTEIGPGDRFLVSKLMTPRRWDIIVFRLPEDPSYFYVKRLVGLPGEELFIRDGCVWINGKKLDPPKSLEGIEYLATLEPAPFPSWAEESNAAQLGLGEYFVLGDFSAQASDSRFWQKGAPGHPAYAVPEDYIIGVVTHIYWPPERWRAFR